MTKRASEIRYRETASGPSYIGSTVRYGITYYYTILFPYGLGPKLLIGSNFYTIDKPERFGAWETKKERRAFVRAFGKPH